MLPSFLYSTFGFAVVSLNSFASLFSKRFLFEIFSSSFPDFYYPILWPWFFKCCLAASFESMKSLAVLNRFKNSLDLFHLVGVAAFLLWTPGVPGA